MRFYIWFLVVCFGFIPLSVYAVGDFDDETATSTPIYSDLGSQYFMLDSLSGDGFFEVDETGEVLDVNCDQHACFLYPMDDNTGSFNANGLWPFTIIESASTHLGEWEVIGTTAENECYIPEGVRNWNRTMCEASGSSFHYIDMVYSAGATWDAIWQFQEEETGETLATTTDILKIGRDISFGISIIMVLMFLIAIGFIWNSMHLKIP